MITDNEMNAAVSKALTATPEEIADTQAYVEGMMPGSVKFSKVCATAVRALVNEYNMDPKMGLIVISVLAEAWGDASIAEIEADDSNDPDDLDDLDYDERGSGF